MRKSIGIVALVLFAGLGWGIAQEKPPAEKQASEKPKEVRENWVAKVIPVKHADVRAIADVLRVLSLNILPNPEMRIIGVSGPPHIVMAVEEAIARLDVPPVPTPNVELTAYLLLTSDSPGTVPQELEPVLKQLRGTFGFKNYRLAETAVLRSRGAGSARTKASTSGILPSPTAGLPAGHYTLEIESAKATNGRGDRQIAIDGLRLGMRIPVPDRVGTHEHQFRDTGISTNLDFKEGQKVVVGKANLSGQDEALFLVISARVME